jgi:hypothetical protein
LNYFLDVYPNTFICRIKTQSQPHIIYQRERIGALSGGPTVKFLTATALALIALTAAAHAQTPRTMENSAGLPPHEYDRPYQGAIGIVRLGAELIGKICPKTPFTTTLGCAFIGKDECLIVLAEDRIIHDAGWTPDIIKRLPRAGGSGS